MRGQTLTKYPFSSRPTCLPRGKVRPAKTCCRTCTASAKRPVQVEVQCQLQIFAARAGRASARPKALNNWLQSHRRSPEPASCRLFSFWPSTADIAREPTAEAIDEIRVARVKSLHEWRQALPRDASGRVPSFTIDQLVQQAKAVREAGFLGYK